MVNLSHGWQNILGYLLVFKNWEGVSGRSQPFCINYQSERKTPCFSYGECQES